VQDIVQIEQLDGKIFINPNQDVSYWDNLITANNPTESRWSANSSAKDLSLLNIVALEVGNHRNASYLAPKVDKVIGFRQDFHSERYNLRDSAWRRAKLLQIRPINPPVGHSVVSPAWPSKSQVIAISDEEEGTTTKVISSTSEHSVKKRKEPTSSDVEVLIPALAKKVKPRLKKPKLQ